MKLTGCVRCIDRVDAGIYNNAMKTNYPIVLVHGLGIKDMLWLKAFGKIDRILRMQGYTVFTSKIDAFGTIEGNAAQLRDEILQILEAEHVDKVNLIAHSKGGLDAKYMLANEGMAHCVASLTTLCTPHRGSPIASFILRFPSTLVKYAAFWVNLLYRMLGDKAPDAYTACRQLKRVAHVEYEALCRIKGVFCQSFSATMKVGDKRSDFIMSIPAFFSRILEKSSLTDGLVPQDSAIYGEYRGDCIDDSISHTEIIDFMVRGKKRDKIFAFYSALLEELTEMGF